MRRLLVVCLLCLMIAAPLYAQEDDPYTIALQRIEAARETNATGLNLSQLGLTELPPEIGRLNNLEILHLFSNQLMSLPPEIGQLSMLRALYLSNNELTVLPPTIGLLSKLEALSLSNNQLITLPPEIGQLTNLQWLSIHNNQLTMLPSEMGQLRSLCFLDLGRNNLQDLPAALSNLDLLTEDWIECFSTDSYSGLNLYNNPLISPPQEVVEQGTAAVLDYLRNPVWYYIREPILGAAAGVGLLVLLVLGIRWKQYGERKPKQKRGL